MTNGPHHWITTPITQAILHGALELETTARGVRPHRLPARARAQCNDPQLAMVESQPSGVRLVFRTTSSAIELDVLPTRYLYAGVPPRPSGVYDLVVDGQLVQQARATGGDVVTIDMGTGAVSKQSSEPGTLRFSGLSSHEKTVEIWLPHNETAELVALRTHARLEPGRAESRKVWLHHGSSISQGSNAPSPTTIWPALAASIGQVELINLGFGGSALLDPFTARTLRDTPADLISVKLGINLCNTDLMRARAFTPAVHGFLDTIREGHPATPLVVISPLYCPIHEDTPGPGAFDPDALAAGKISFKATGDAAERKTGKLTLRFIRDELQRIVTQRAGDDPHLHYVDGLTLYGETDFAELPLPDQLHPDGPAHGRIGERFGRLAFGHGGPFGAARD
ncbi:SGNH/GDSL hydrolase family protein [Paraburkholderia sp. BL21I4N1]|uniref:SGNH/GDSL hydrolase family protein n=1 Tax=Paraburkholderia sp. BL21I4N1 TaxID=1938801 RepID=UPI000CFB83A0|nr:SGNH/GDSL hydrolase family protein [Paraburkholderia sp. BL21I4N1]PQV55003.1 GDSL-like lipase/acylhydrolase family protein [Paraburkholderia sp. BL21I4N1]